MTTPLTARNEVMDMFTTGWTTPAATIAGQAVPIAYDDRGASRPKTDDPSAGTKFWVRLSMQHATGEQTSLGGDDGKSRFQLDGVLTIQIFCPLGVGLAVADLLGELALSIFRGKRTPSGVRFRNHRIREAGNDGPWSQTNALVEFYYDQHG